MQKNWFVFYTKSRQEKKVRDLLLRRGFDVFLPLQKVLRQWSDRKKRVEVPLFNSYIFVAVPEHAVTSVLEVPGVAWAIKHNGKPATLHPREYDTIVRFIETGLLIESLPAEDVEVGEEVTVLDGPLKGMKGSISAKGTGKFTVILEGLGQAIRAEVDAVLIRSTGVSGDEMKPKGGQGYWTR